LRVSTSELMSSTVKWKCSVPIESRQSLEEDAMLIEEVEQK